LLILEKERNLALEKALAEEKVKVEKLAIDLSLTNDPKDRMSKETTLINESLASLNATHSELQESFSCLTSRNGHEVDTKPEPKVAYKEGRRSHKKDGLGHYKGGKVNDRKVVKGKECVMFTKGSNLEDLMNIAHGVTTIPSQPKKKIEDPIKAKITKHEPSPSYTTNYMVTIDRNGKIVVKYVGAYTKKAILRSVWVPKVYPSNPQGPKFFRYLNSKLNFFYRPTPRVAPHGCLIVDAQII
jgi:hypothetical protein